ncbi:MAG: aminopeptidase [Lachnospiraceae bacterium]
MPGECALVPYESPIRRGGITASANTLSRRERRLPPRPGPWLLQQHPRLRKYSLDELRAMGVNDSMVHEDFMIGSAELDITGLTASGERLPIFRSGGWAF